MRELRWAACFVLVGCATEEPPVVTPAPPPIATRSAPVEAPLARARRFSTDFATKPERDEAQAIFQSLCDRGNQEGCASLGRMRFKTQSSNTTDDDRKQTWALAQRACESGVAAGCTLLGWLIKDARGRRGFRQEGEDLEAMKKGCDGGDPDGCAGLFELLPSASDPDWKKRFSWAMTGCDGGSAEGCMIVAAAYRVGSGVERDATKVAPYFRRSCEGGELAARKQWFDSMWYSGPRDTAGYEAGTREICEMGSGFACMALARLYREAVFDPGAQERAVAAEEAACKRDWLDACKKLSVSYRAKGKLDLAERLQKRSCDLGEKRACDAAPLEDDPTPEEVWNAKAEEDCERGVPIPCEQLGSKLVSRRQKPDDLEKGRALLERACELRDSLCDSLAFEYQSGKNLTHDQIHANQLLERACKGGSGGGCWWLGMAYLDGRGTEKNEALAARYLKLGCEGKMLEACQQLAKLQKPR